MDTVTLLEDPERVKDYRRSCKLQKLLRPIARHPAATSGGGNKCSVHENLEERDLSVQYALACRI